MNFPPSKTFPDIENIIKKSEELTTFVDESQTRISVGDIVSCSFLDKTILLVEEIGANFVILSKLYPEPNNEKFTISPEFLIKLDNKTSQILFNT